MARKKVEEVNETKNIIKAFKALCEDKGLSTSVVVEAISEALKKAYFKATGDYTDSIIKVNFDIKTGEISMFKVKNVVAEIQDDVFETDPEEAFDETGKQYKVGDVMEIPINVSEFRRAAAMQVKSVFKQKLREAEKQLVADQFADKVGEIISGTVEVVEAKHCILKVSNYTSAYLTKTKMLPNETYKIGDIIKVYVEEVDKNATGAPIIVSRTNPKFISKLMEQDISEISDGIVEIKGVSRQPGSRSKVAVYSKDPNVDASGACIGHSGSRIARVLSQIGDEKIDVVNYNENPLLYVADALKPAIVIGMQMVDEEAKTCRAIVDESQYSLAIGKEAQNVNLAVRLTNWKIDIKSVEDADAKGYKYELVEDLKFRANAKKIRSTTVTTTTKVANPVVNDVNESVVEDVVTPVTPVTNPTKPVTKAATPVTDTIAKDENVVTPIKSNTTSSFSELEAALNSPTTQQETKTFKKKQYKKYDEEEEPTEKVETTKKPVSSFVAPTYTAEELREIEEERRAEEESKYSDYDEEELDAYDDFYDDDDN